MGSTADWAADREEEERYAKLVTVCQSVTDGRNAVKVVTMVADLCTLLEKTEQSRHVWQIIDSLKEAIKYHEVRRLQ